MSEFEWIPIEEKFPPYDQKVLILNFYYWPDDFPLGRKRQLRIVEGSFSREKGWKFEECEQRGIIVDVRFWMAYPPIPDMKEEPQMETQ